MTSGSSTLKAIFGGFCVGLAALTVCGLNGCASSGGGPQAAAPAPRTSATPAGQGTGTPAVRLTQGKIPAPSSAAAPTTPAMLSAGAPASNAATFSDQVVASVNSRK